MSLYGIANCDTVKRARGWLEGRGTEYAFHDYKKLGVEAERLAGWAARLGWEALVNRRGTTFRALPEADKAGLDEARALRLMAAQPSLIRRPVVEVGDTLLVGFDSEAWAAAGL